MRLLLLNPNTSSSMTERMTAVAESVKAPTTEIVPITAPRGLPYIANRAEAQIGGTIALEMLAEHHTDVDAAIIAAFGDPGLFGARELFDIPVIGLAEAAMLTACMVGRRFVIVTFARALGPWYEDCVAMHRLGERCAGIVCLDSPFTQADDIAERKEALLVDLANKAVSELDADAVILAGAPLTGLADKVATRIPVPVIDQVAAAVKQAEAVSTLALRKPTAGTFRRPTPKSTMLLPTKLAMRIEQTDHGGVADATSRRSTG